MHVHVCVGAQAQQTRLAVVVEEEVQVAPLVRALCQVVMLFYSVVHHAAPLHCVCVYGTGAGGA